MVLVSSTEIIQVFFPKQFTFDWIDLFLTIAVSFFTIIFWPYEKKIVFNIILLIGVVLFY